MPGKNKRKQGENRIGKGSKNKKHHQQAQKKQPTLAGGGLHHSSSAPSFSSVTYPQPLTEVVAGQQYFSTPTLFPNLMFSSAPSSQSISGMNVQVLDTKAQDSKENFLTLRVIYNK